MKRSRLAQEMTEHAIVYAVIAAPFVFIAAILLFSWQQTTAAQASPGERTATQIASSIRSELVFDSISDIECGAAPTKVDTSKLLYAPRGMRGAQVWCQRIGAEAHVTVQIDGKKHEIRVVA